MPRRTPRDTRDSLVAQIAAQADGLGIEQLTAANPDVPRRTLQRHLLRLVEDGAHQGHRPGRGDPILGC